MAKKRLLIFLLIVNMFGISSGKNERSMIQWHLDTWESCPVDAEFLQIKENHTFSDDEVRMFISSSEFFKNIWITGWLQILTEDSWDIELQQLTCEKNVTGIYVNRVPYVESLENVKPQGTYSWRRISINVLVDMREVKVDHFTNLIFNDIQPSLITKRSAYSGTEQKYEDGLAYVSIPEVNDLKERLIPEDYWKGFSAEILCIETIYRESSINWDFFNSYCNSNEFSCWVVSFWVGNSLYPYAIRTVYNHNFAEIDPTMLAGGYTFGGGFEYVAPGADNHFAAGFVFSVKEEIHQSKWRLEDNLRIIEMIKHRLEEDKLACKISFEPLMRAYGGGEAGGPYYFDFLYRYDF